MTLWFQKFLYLEGTTHSTPNSGGKSLILHPDTVLQMTAIDDFSLPLNDWSGKWVESTYVYSTNIQHSQRADKHMHRIPENRDLSEVKSKFLLYTMQQQGKDNISMPGCLTCCCLVRGSCVGDGPCWTLFVSHPSDPSLLTLVSVEWTDSCSERITIMEMKLITFRYIAYTKTNSTYTILWWLRPWKWMVGTFLFFSGN